MATSSGPTPEGIFSLLDTDLYKLTMQSAVLKYFPEVEVTYDFTNRTPDMRLDRKAFEWLKVQIDRLSNIVVSKEEIDYLRQSCPYLSEEYLQFFSNFRLHPSSHVTCTFTPVNDEGHPDGIGDLALHTKGRWIDTILYEIPLLALTSEAYFRFVDRDWSYDGQRANAKEKGIRLAEAGCVVSEFGTRRRRDYHTHELIIQGLMDAQAEANERSFPGKITSTSNVHLAMRFGLTPIGTVAHEWFMGVAAVSGSYPGATEMALRNWIGTFGKRVLGIVLTDTFGTPHFLDTFKRNLPPEAQPEGADGVNTPKQRYADVFNGTRQDSGDPLEFIKTMRAFYDQAGITEKKAIVFSDSLNVEKAIEYREAAEKAGFQPSFGIGTFLTNDFKCLSTGKTSAPLNIVIKISSANGKPAVKISDNIGKNTGDHDTVEAVKEQLGYTERKWADGDERTRWVANGGE